MTMRTMEAFAPGSQQRLARARLSPSGLDVWFADGLLCRLPLAELLATVGKFPVGVALSRENEVVLKVGRRNHFLPWDFFRHRADAAYATAMQLEEATGLQTAGQRIRTWRERCGITQTALAQAAAVGRVTLSRIEAGQQRASLVTLEALAKALGLTVGELVAG